MNMPRTKKPLILVAVLVLLAAVVAMFSATERAQMQEELAQRANSTVEH